MSEPILDGPELAYGTITGRLIGAWADGVDANLHPDLSTVANIKLKLTPSVTAVTWTGEGEPTLIVLKPIELEVSSSDGRIRRVGDMSEAATRIAATTGPGIEPPFTWKLTWEGVGLKEVPFELAAGETKNVASIILSTLVPTPAALYADLQAQAEVLEALLRDGGRGIGIESITQPQPSQLLFNLTDGTSAAFEVPVGEDGLSAYELAVAGGYTGTMSEWLASLKGEDGDTPALPPISWEDDQLRFGDLLSPPLTGPVSSLTIGTVTTGTPSASITGTAPDQELNLVLPPGTPGAPGAPGAVATSSTYLIVGPGRPDVPATTGGTITGSEPVGAEYRSTDGAGVGAWVWMKRPGGKWVVADGDTGWRNVAALRLNGTEGALRIQRTQNGVVAQGEHTNAPTVETSIYTLTDGWRPPPGSGLANGLSGSGGYIIISASHTTSPTLAVKGGGTWARFSITFPSGDPWPTTLPGAPA